MRRLSLLLLMLLSPLVAAAQSGYTSVTAVVHDPNDQLYVNAPYSITFVDPGTSGKLPLINGSTFQQSYTGINTDAFSNLVATLPDNNLICSTSGECGTQWKFNICSQKIQGAVYCFNTTLTITGSSMDISAQLKAAAAVLPIIGSVINISIAGAPNCLPALYTCTITNPTVNPVITFTQINEAAHLVFAGPSSGGAAASTFRLLVAGDLPGSGSTTINGTTCTIGGSCSIAGVGSVTSVDLVVPSWLVVTGCPITTAGTCIIAPATGQTTNRVIGTCNGATTFTPCALGPSNVPPTINSRVTVGIAADSAVSSNTPTDIFTVHGSDPTLTMPSSGCPCTVYASYFMYIKQPQNSNIPTDFWVSMNDGTTTTIFASSDIRGDGNGMSAGQLSQASVANGATVTFQLITEAAQNYTIAKNMLFSSQGSWFSAYAVTTN